MVTNANDVCASRVVGPARVFSAIERVGETFLRGLDCHKLRTATRAIQASAILTE
jgi:hypothetical protein